MRTMMLLLLSLVLGLVTRVPDCTSYTLQAVTSPTTTINGALTNQVNALANRQTCFRRANEFGFVDTEQGTCLCDLHGWRGFQTFPYHFTIDSALR